MAEKKSRRSTRKNDGLTARIVVLMTQEEREFLRQIAFDESRSLSAHLRFLALQEIDAKLDI